ncbi:MAG: 3-hydroxybutyrate dehydrogenase [Proteobacteria bacterium]|nr:3-hydroxybutyrate dehydrogenase [Pseudomonadota bacterium]MCH9054016.1 3-hydroxybutyrate dehydrogenase [Pseudomonadota bacterium]
MLKAKSALVTGATSGIGHAIARALAAEGCNIVFNGLGDGAEIEALRRAISEDFGVEAVFHRADLGKPEEIPGLIEAAEAGFGRLDILVNNAGIQFVSPIDEFPIAKWDEIIAINLSASFHTIRAALPGMKRRDWGRIVNIASVLGLVASIDKSAYVAAKHGILGLTKTVTLETAGFDITCNAICPGYVRTPLIERQIEALAAAHGLTIEDAAAEHLAEKHPSPEFIAAEEVAALVVFLCGTAAAGINGAALPMDRGWLAR